MDFGEVIFGLKQGGCFRRPFWTPGVFLYLELGSTPAGTPYSGGLIYGLPEVVFNTGDAGTAIRMPELRIKAPIPTSAVALTADDMLAEDWVEADPDE